MKKKRDPLAKENFLVANREKWCLIFTVTGLSILGLDAYNIVENPIPYLEYFTSLGVTFILGASATAVIKTLRAPTNDTNNNVPTEPVPEPEPTVRGPRATEE